MSQSAVLLGRTTADVANNVIVLVVMSLTGLIVGWRIRTSILSALAAYLLLLAFAYAFSWVMSYVGLAVRAPEVVNNASFIVIFPLTFIANTFVPTNNFPPVLKAFADWNPISSVAYSARQLFGNLPAAAETPASWPMQHSVAYVLLWVVAILAVFVPLSVRQYKRAVTR
jgi:ABC-type polysaccharide/polyol phosphate export permease